MSIRVMIADDDGGMRLVIKKAIDKSGDFTIVGEAEDGDAALRLYEEQRPDVVFLDVEMPHATGVECAKRIADIDPKTVILFATAHEEYMPEAFEVYAFDYLVKPFKIERLYQTLERMKAVFYVNKPDGGEKWQDIPPISDSLDFNAMKKPHDLIDEEARLKPPDFMKNREKTVSTEHVAREKLKSPGKLMIRNRDGINLVSMEEIILIQREERSTVIYTAHERFATSEGLSEIEEKLNGNLFFRCHKSYIINLSSVCRIYPYGRWTYVVKLKGTEKDALLTHDKYEELERMFT